MSGYSVTETARITGFPKTLINKKIWLGEIPTTNGLVEENAVKRILSEKERYVSVEQFAKSHSTDAFNGNSSIDRGKLLDVIEKNDYFNLETVNYTDICMGTKTDVVFFLKEDEPILEKNLREFFRQFDVSERQKIEDLLSSSDIKHKTTAILMKSFLNEFIYKSDSDSVPPSVTEFVREVLTMPDVTMLKTDDIAEYMKKEVSIACKEIIVRFLNYCKGKTRVHYKETSMKPIESRSVPAYSDDTYIAIMRCVFNSEYIAEHRMIEKALNNYLYAETWLYLSLFITCGWRAKDICTGWKYPNLSDRENGFLGINTDTLSEDILNDRLSDKVYEDVCKFCLTSVSVSGQLPSKTSARNPAPLQDIIVPELYTFFGMLTLIGEAVMLKTGNGHMNPLRASLY